jgi:hypothetical protein
LALRAPKRPVGCSSPRPEIQHDPGAWSTRPGAKYRKWWIIILVMGSGLAFFRFESTSTCSLNPVM